MVGIAFCERITCDRIEHKRRPIINRALWSSRRGMVLQTLWASFGTFHSRVFADFPIFFFSFSFFCYFHRLLWFSFLYLPFFFFLYIFLLYFMFKIHYPILNSRTHFKFLKSFLNLWTFLKFTNIIWILKLDFKFLTFFKSSFFWLSQHFLFFLNSSSNSWSFI